MLPLRHLVPFAFAASATAQLAGLYTINPVLPTIGNNFMSLADATSALASQGVAGPVFFELYDDAGPFTEATPFATTSGPYAPNTAVLVMSSWTGASTTNRVTFRPAPGESPVFDATGRSMGVFWGGADYVTLQGIEIKNAIHDAISLYAEQTHGIAQDPIIDGCILHDCGGTGVTIYGNTPPPTNTLVQNCAMWHLQLTNAGSFNTTGRFGYVTTRRSTGTRIVHNTFVADTGVGSSFCVIGSYPSAVTEIPYAEVSNNIVVKLANASAPIYRINSPSGAAALVPVIDDSNCFFDTSSGPFALWNTNGTTVAATLLDWQLGAQRDLLSLAADPLLRSIAGHDLHLTVLSPCRDASTVVANVLLDVDGQVRTVPADIGADEFSAATATSVGTGCAGSGNLAPSLHANWPFLGNPNFTLRAEAMPAGAIGVWFGSVGLAAVPIPFGAGCTIYLDPTTLVSLAAQFAGPAGTASVVYALPANPAFIGVDIAYQVLALDAGAPLGFTFTNAVDVIFDF
jgi:hypothetical protein